MKQNLLLVILLLFATPLSAQERDSRADFAQCLAEKGATLYVADWCPWCAKQLDAFGPSGKEALNVVHCHDGRHNEKACASANVRAIPLWTFKDGTRLLGLQDNETLSKHSGCPLPE